MKVPLPIKAVFDAFPLASYPPIPSTTLEKQNAVESCKFYYTGNTNDSFQLGIHNVIEVNGKMLPSDPICCFYSLILAQKNNLKIPQPNSDVKNGNCLVVVSPYSAVDNQLPILIETTGDSRTINSSSAISTMITKKLSGKDVIVGQLFTSLYDCWILCLLCEDLSSETLHKIFHVNTETALLDTTDLYQQIPLWQAFKTRHPTLFDAHYNVNNHILRRNTMALQSYYNSKLDDLTTELDLLVAYKDSKVISTKLLAYFITINETLATTKLGQIIATHPTYLEQCYTQIQRN
jgi:sorting and assembly machinery component 35